MWVSSPRVVTAKNGECFFCSTWRWDKYLESTLWKRGISSHLSTRLIGFDLISGWELYLTFHSHFLKPKFLKEIVQAFEELCQNQQDFVLILNYWHLIQDTIKCSISEISRKIHSGVQVVDCELPKAHPGSANGCSRVVKNDSAK